MGFFSRMSKKAAGPSPIKPACIEELPLREQWRDSELQRVEDTTKAVEYQYSILDTKRKEIRLLKVLSGGGSEPLCCTLHHISLLGDSAGYETISYSWGQSTVTKIIQIDGKPTAVGSSAAGVLYRMRSATSDRLVWIDAICIDQKSDTEKSHQVALMGLIYSMGWRNLVWLGDDHGTANKCDETIRSVLTDVCHRTHAFETMWATLTSGPFTRLDSAMGSSVRVAPLSHLFESRWFSRLWVAQEAALAPYSVCHYGPLSFALVDVLRCAAWLNHADIFLPHCLRESSGLANAARLWRLVDVEIIPAHQFQSATEDLYTIYNRTRRLECSVPKDKIYALLGIFQNRNQEPSLLLKPVYQGRSDMEVFRDATRLMLGGFKHLELLRVDHFPSPNPEWPSWVVNFARKRDMLPLQAPKQFCPDAHLPFRMDDSRCPNEIILHGTEVDVVVDCTTAVNRKLVPNQCYSQRILNMLQSIHELIKDFPFAHGEIYKTLIAGSNWQYSEAGREDLEDYNLFLRHLQRFPKVPRAAKWPSMTQYGPDVERAIRYFHKLSSTVYTRRFFITKHGLFGIGPGILEAGDVVAILYGSQFPFVLRPVGAKRYRLVGECYVSCIMHGEAVRPCRYMSSMFTIV